MRSTRSDVICSFAFLEGRGDRGLAGSEKLAGSLVGLVILEPSLQGPWSEAGMSLGAPLSEWTRSFDLLCWVSNVVIHQDQPALLWP